MLEHPHLPDDLGTATHVELSTNIQNVLLDSIPAEDKMMSNLQVRSTIQQ